MPWPENALTDDEAVIMSFRQHWKLLAIPFAWFLGVLIALFVILQWIPGGATADLILSLVVIAAFGWFVVRLRPPLPAARIRPPTKHPSFRRFPAS